ncbi:MAG: hypothetical protein K2L72_01335, partial [Clostridia bacterium]|nr:hypothetical protein [Clostridia bacterium]
MSKAKSVVITVILAIAVAVAAFFAAISFPVANNVKRLNSIASNIRLGADFSGYAYTTVYPEGVLTAEEFSAIDDEDKSDYDKVGGLYVDKETHPDIEQLKADVAADAAILNKRFGQKGYSSYSVAVEDGVSIKISVPTNFSRAAYMNNDDDTRSSALSVASAALSSMSAYGGLTLRTTDTSISMTDESGNSITYDVTKKGKDEWVEKAQVNNADTYSLADGDDVADYFKSITSRAVGSSAIITFNLTKEGREKFYELTTRAASSSSQTIYFFVGDRQLVSFSCETAVNQKSLSLQSSDAVTAQNSAITMNSAVKGDTLKLEYKDLDSVITSSATGGDNASLFAFIACLLVLVGLIILLCVKYKKLGAVTSFISVIFALVELYALYLLNIQVTFAVIVVSMLCLALFVISNALVFAEVRRLTEGGRVIQAAIKDAYKNLIMTITDLHIVLVVVAILLAAVGVGEVAACGLIAVIGVVASYVLYWFTRFMWYVESSPERDKF